LKELGLFCGTFNPIHWGHLLIAESARDQFQLDKVLFITCANPPHRHNDLLNMEDRHQMVQAAVSANPCFEASRLELDRPGPSYTVDTLRAVRKNYGLNVRLNLIVGGDNVPQLTQWHDFDEIIQLCRIMVAPRASSTPVVTTRSADQEPEGLRGADAVVIDFPPVQISSSSVREHLRQGRSVLYMVTPEVNRLLLEKGHYRP